MELGLPGLAQEVTELCTQIGLEDICRGRPNRISKEKIQESIFYNHLKHLKVDMGALKKKGKKPNQVDIRRPQEYLASCSLAEARMAFRVQNQMLDIPGDMPGRYLGREACKACVAWRGVDERLEVCQGYAFLRAGKDLCILKDRTRYFMAVMTMRNGKSYKLYISGQGLLACSAR